MWYVYTLYDKNNRPFYVGITKNLEVRIGEHSRNKNATPKKIYRVRESIKAFGELKHKYIECDNESDARKIERRLIKKYNVMLVNVTHGTNRRRDKQLRSSGRSVQCKHCKCYFKRINSHKCKAGKNESR